MAPSFDKKHVLASNLLPAKRQKIDTTKAGDNEEALEAMFEEDVGVGARRKKLVKDDGYESDSSNEGHGVEFAANKNSAANVEEEDDDDMFGEAAPAESGKPTVPGIDDDDDDYDERNDRWAEEGQLKQSEFMDIVDENSDIAADQEEDEYDSDDKEVGALGRKVNAPKMDAYNMDAELEEGAFDEAGNYVRRKKDPKDSQDNWLKDVSRKDIEIAKEAVQRRHEEERERQRKEQKEDEVSVAELLAEIIGILDRGETVLECLARLGASTEPKRIRRRHQQRSSSKMAGKETQKDVLDVERITKLASRLMAKSQIDVYDTEKEALARLYKRETGTDLDLMEPGDEVMQDDENNETSAAAGEENCWEFVWAGAEDNINGPYDASTMKAWLEDGLLSSDGTHALVRRVGEITFVEADLAIFNS